MFGIHATRACWHFNCQSVPPSRVELELKDSEPFVQTTTLQRMYAYIALPFRCGHRESELFNQHNLLSKMPSTLRVFKTSYI